MLTPCKKLYYAIEAVVMIAHYSNGHPISSRDISRQQGLPSRYLEQIMQRLVHGGILKGVRGPKGGYLLARDASQITLKQVCELINEEDVIHNIPPTTEIGNTIVRPYWEDLCGRINCEMEDVSIAKLCKEAQQKNISTKRTSVFA